MEPVADLAAMRQRERGLDRVIAIVYPDNARSLAVCRRLGMVHHGLSDKYYGITVELFSLERPDPAGPAPAA